MASCFYIMGPMDGQTGMSCSSQAAVDMSVDQVEATAAQFLVGPACWGELAGLGACCPVDGVGCCRGWWCAFHHVLRANSELCTRVKSAIYDCLVLQMFAVYFSPVFLWH